MDIEWRIVWTQQIAVKSVKSPRKALVNYILVTTREHSANYFPFSREIICQFTTTTRSGFCQVNLWYLWQIKYFDLDKCGVSLCHDDSSLPEGPGWWQEQYEQYLGRDHHGVTWHQPIREQHWVRWPMRGQGSSWWPPSDVSVSPDSCHLSSETQTLSQYCHWLSHSDL